jgi:7-cyano-7-deazaguanine synthase
MAKDLAVILNSGGLSSAVVSALAAQKFRLILVHIESFGAAPARRRAAYDQQLAHFKPYREHTLALPFLAGLEPQPHTMPALSDPRVTSAIAPVLIEVMPLIALAARFAVHYQASAVYAGVRIGPQGDDLASATEYAQIWNEMLQIPCAQPDLELTLPLLELEPWQVVDVGVQVGAPLEKTWSCFEEGVEPCGSCRGCRAREAAFAQAVKPDPVIPQKAVRPT